jgi:hypothetical protein
VIGKAITPLSLARSSSGLISPGLTAVWRAEAIWQTRNIGGNPAACQTINNENEIQLGLTVSDCQT